MLAQSAVDVLDEVTTPRADDPQAPESEKLLNEGKSIDEVREQGVRPPVPRERDRGAQTRDFNYAMGVGHEGEVHEEGYPGLPPGVCTSQRSTAG